MAEKEAPAAAPEKGAAEAPKGDAAAAAAAGGGGLSAGAFMGMAGGFLVVVMGLGFALAFWVLPGQIAKANKAAAAPAAHGAPGAEGHDPAAQADPHAKPEEAPAKDDGHGKKEDAHAKKDDGHGKKDDGHGGGSSSAKEVSEFQLNDVMVNVMGSRGSRFVKASLSFDASHAVLQELESKRPMIIDRVSGILADKPMEEVSAPTARGVLRAQMLNAINPELKKGKVNNIYFLEFVIQ